ncbi:glutamate ABC transporter substrate-binding protein [Spirillospora sp. NPDC050679]
MASVGVRVICCLVLVLGLPGCSSGRADSVVGRGELVIGVKADQPGLAVRGPDGVFRGFEVEVGRYVARRLGASKVTFRAVTSDDRERRLEARAVDLVLASYSITPERAVQVTFGGPYYLARQDIMVRRGERRIRNVRGLAGRRVCQAAGSVSGERVTAGLGIAVRAVPAPSYSACLSRLLAGDVDAVSTGDLVLAGFAAQAAGRVRIVNAPFTDEPYGVGLRKGDIDGCEAVNRAITLMYQDGTAARLLRTWFGASRLRLTESVPQFEGCS